MLFDFQCIHFHLSEDDKDFLDKKMKHLDSLKQYLTDLTLHIKEAQGQPYTFESVLHFEWGIRCHIKTESWEIQKGLSDIIDKIFRKISREKQKKQNHSPRVGSP